MNEKEMAQIPYIEHEHRMFKAYQRENRLKIALIATNALWCVSASVLLIMRCQNERRRYN